MHMSRKDLNSAELEIVRLSRKPTVVITSIGEVQTNEEVTVNVHDYTSVAYVDIAKKSRFGRPKIAG